MDNAIPAGAGELHQLPIDRIFPSKYNKDRAARYDDKQLQELAASIKANGLAQPILVTPIPGGPGKDFDHIIVAGERRWRAHKLAGFPTIAAIVRDLSDKQVLELQIIENMQRVDVHPLQEADGYDKLLHLHGLSIDALCERIGRSRSYVFARLKLRDLCEEARTAFYGDVFGSEIALLLARIPAKDLQKKATQEIVKPQYGDRGPMSYRDAREHVERNYMLRLKEAPFDVADVSLVAGAGTCAACPKRTGNQPELFADIKGPDVCTDPSCWNAKKKESNAKREASARAAGQEIITGAKAKEIFPYYGGAARAGYSGVDDQMHELGYKTPRQALGKNLPQTVLVRHPHTQDLVEVVSDAAIKAAAKAKGVLKQQAPQDKAWREQQRKANVARAVEGNAKRATLEAVRAAAAKAKRNYLVPEVLQVLALAWLDELQWESKKTLGDLYGMTDKDADEDRFWLRKIEGMAPRELQLFLLDLAIVPAVNPNYIHVDLGGGKSALDLVAKLLDVDAAKIKRDAKKESDDKEAERKAKKTAAAKRAKAAKKA